MALSGIGYRSIDRSPIRLSACDVTADELLAAIHKANGHLASLVNATKSMSLNILDVMDFRVLSGLVGEIFAKELASISPYLVQNKSIDGYPDLLQNATSAMAAYIVTCPTASFLDYKFGGIEVKNTFGQKRPGARLSMGVQRIDHIDKRLQWKAHHRKTNNLVALLSDFIDRIPIVVALWYSDQLTEDDWADVQRPEEGSGMTSFSTLKPQGFAKLRLGLKWCYDDDRYLKFTA